MKTKLLFIIILLTLNLLHANSSKKNVTLQLSWLHQFQFAGYYIAKEKGFYSDAGLNVNIKEFNFDLDIQKVLHNKEAQFVVGKTSFIIDKIAGKNIVALASIFQHSPMMLLVRKDSKIANAADLRGKNIMITGDAKNTVAILAMLASQGIKLNEVNIQPHSFDLNDLITGKTDAMASYVSNEPIALKEKKIKYKIIHPKDYGFDFYNGMLFTSQEMIDNDPDSVKAFHDATIKGWEYAFNNINESAKIIYDKYNIQKKSLQNLIKEGQILETLVYDKNGKIGVLDEQRIREIANVFLVMGLINKDYNLDNFIYEYNVMSENKIYLTKKEKLFLEKHMKFTYSGTNWAPMHKYTKDGGLEGIFVDIIKLISKDLNINTVFEKKESWSDVLLDVKNKNLDFALSTGETKDKKKYGLFTKSYFKFPLVIVTKKDVSYISKTSELNDRIVAVGKNFTAHAFLKNNYPEVKLLTVKDSKEALKAVSDNKAHAMIDILPVVAHEIRKMNFTNLKISGETEYNFEVKSFIRNDYPELVSILNKGIDNLGEKKVKEIISKWYSIEYVSKIDYDMVLEVILFFTILIVLIVYIQNRRLKEYNKKLKLTLNNLKETQENLIAAEKMATLGELVGGVTHEIISPLSVGIMGSSYIVELTKDIEKLYNTRDMSESEFDEYLKNINEISESITLNLNRTKDLVNSFKDVAIDQTIEDERDFNIKLYLDEILLSLTSKLKKTNIKITIECDYKLVIKGYPGYIAQILINFINNSLLHGFEKDEEGEIKILVNEMDDQLELIYKDNGRGIAQNKQDKIFDKFYTTKKRNGGTGLGLHIVKSIVQNKLNGTIDFKSEPGNGVEITIVIPI